MGMINVEQVRAEALKELAPMIEPAQEFLAYVKGCLVSGVDTISKSQIENWMFSIPTLYGELRCIEVDFFLTADLMDSQIDKVKADAITNKGDGKVTDARARAAQATHDLQVRQQVAKYLGKYVNAIWSQFEMLIFSVRALYESRHQKVNNDV